MQKLNDVRFQRNEKIGKNGIKPHKSLFFVIKSPFRQINKNALLKQETKP